MTQSYQRFGFFLETGERIRSDAPELLRRQVSLGNRTDRGARAQWLEIPPGGPACLTRTDDGKLAVVQEAVDAAAIAMLEPIVFERRGYVAMVAPAGQTVRVNGAPAPPAAVLRVADQIEWDASCVLHLSMYRQPYLGPARPEDIGNECPTCRGAFEETSEVLVCVQCGVALHCEQQTPTREAPLECARVATECPRCGHALVTEEGYEYVPEL